MGRDTGGMSRELVSYIRESRDLNGTKDEIRRALVEVGWREDLVEDGLLEVFGPESDAWWFSPRGWRDILEGKRRYVWWWGVGLLALLALFLSLRPMYLVFWYGWDWVSHWDTRVVRLAELVLPGELEIYIENGRLSTNVSEPYFVTVSEGELMRALGVEGEFGESKLRLVTIDTHATKSDFAKYQSLSMVTDSTIYYYDENEGVIERSLGDFDAEVISQAVLLEKVEELREDWNLSWWLWLGLCLAPMVIFVGMVLGVLVYAAWLTLIVWVMMRLLGVRVHVWSFCVAMYCSLGVVLAVFSWVLPGWPWGTLGYMMMLVLTYEWLLVIQKKRSV